jgi:hypothetical protein
MPYRPATLRYTLRPILVTSVSFLPHSRRRQLSACCASVYAPTLGASAHFTGSVNSCFCSS